VIKIEITAASLTDLIQDLTASFPALVAPARPAAATAVNFTFAEDLDTPLKPDDPDARPEPAFATPQRPKSDGDGAEAPVPAGAAPATPAKKGKPKKIEPELVTIPDSSPAIDRVALIKSLTDVYQHGGQDIKERIIAFRDAQGVQRLKDLKDDILPQAMQLLTELQALTP
jgi:hypothetical protein